MNEHTKDKARTTITIANAVNKSTSHANKCACMYVQETIHGHVDNRLKESAEVGVDARRRFPP